MLKMSEYPVVDRDADIEYCVKCIFNGNNNADNEFTNALKTLLTNSFQLYEKAGYYYWFDDDRDASPMRNLLYRQMLSNYKYIDYFRTRWLAVNGASYGDVETETTDITEQNVIDNDFQTNMTDTSNTTYGSTYKQNGSNTTNTTDTRNYTTTDKAQGENSPLGSALGDITTPYSKDISENKETGTGTTEDISTIDRTDTNSGTSDRTSTHTGTSQTDETRNKTGKHDRKKTNTHALEELKAIKYYGINIVEVLDNCVRALIDEFNSFN